MAKVYRRGVGAVAKKANKSHKRPCRSAPEVPANVALAFRRREVGKREIWRAISSASAVTVDVAGRPITVELYEVELRATDASGDPVETQLQAASATADGADFTVHSGSAPVNQLARELNSSGDVIKKTLTGLTAGIDAVVDFYARKDLAGSSPTIKCEIWNATDGTSVASKNATPDTHVKPKVVATRSFTPVAGKTYEARISFQSGSGIALFHQIQWHDKGTAAVWRKRIAGDADDLDVVFSPLVRPHSWYEQTRRRAMNRVNGARCWSAWSAWTAPVQPATGALTGPPAPTGVTLTLDKVEGTKKHPWRARAGWNETPWWIPPDDDPVEGASQYHVQMQVSHDGGTTVANTRNQTVPADPTQTTNKFDFFNIKRKRSYRQHVKAMSPDGRWGAYSAYTSWVTVGGSPADPTNVVCTNPTVGTLKVTWDPPTDLSDVDGFKVVIRRKDGGAGTIVETDYVGSHRTKYLYDIPFADRIYNHTAKVHTFEDEITLDLDTGTVGWDAGTESAGVESSDTAVNREIDIDELDVTASTRRIIRAEGVPRLRIRRAATQSIPDGAGTNVVDWDTEEVDTDAFGDISVDYATMTFTGSYRVTAVARFATNATGRRTCWVQIDVGATGTWADIPTLYSSVVPVTGDVTTPLVTNTIQVTAGDRLRVRVFQNSGAALNLQDASLAIEFLGPA